MRVADAKPLAPVPSKGTSTPKGPDMASRPVIDLDHHSEAYAREGLEQVAVLREKCPVGWSEAHGGFWAVTRHADVTEVLRCPEIFTSGKHQGADGIWTGGSTIPTSQRDPLLPLEQDGPRAVAYRRLVTKWTSRSAVDALVPSMEVMTDHLLNRVIESGRIDFVNDLGNPLPAMVIMRILGFDLNGWERFAWPFHALEAAPRDSEDFARCLEEFGWIREQLALACEKRRAEPGKDAISELAAARVDGELVPIDDCVGILMTFIGGGVDTTTATLAHSLRYLSQTPQDRAALQEDPERIPLAVEEFLRCFPPVRQLARTVAGETEFRGMHMLDRERVHVSVLSANHDEATFADASQVDITRAPNAHVSFGLGLHRCAGLNVARAELAVMLAKVLSRVPDFQVIEEGSSRYDEAGNVDGWVAMPATFAPGNQVTADVAALGITEQ